MSICTIAFGAVSAVTLLTSSLAIEDEAAKSKPDPAAALDRGIAWLVSHQNDDGSFTGTVGFKLNQNYKLESDAKPHIAVTALAGLALLARQQRTEAESKSLGRVAKYVLGQANPDTGYLAGDGTRVYGHAFATLFLAEAKGKLEIEGLDKALEKAVKAIVEGQNEYGGWRYELGAVETDLSVTSCVLAALDVAKRKGVEVPDATFDRARKLVEQLYVDDDRRAFPGYPIEDGYYFLRRGAFKYQQQESTRSSCALTGAGITAASICGKTSSELRESLDVLEDSYVLAEAMAPHYFYWYSQFHAAHALHDAGGDWWFRWNARVRADLANRIEADGSWKNDVGPGDAFATAVACLVLQADGGGLTIFGTKRS